MWIDFVRLPSLAKWKLENGKKSAGATYLAYLNQ